MGCACAACISQDNNVVMVQCPTAGNALPTTIAGSMGQEKGVLLSPARQRAFDGV